MRSYRIIDVEGVELARVEAANLAEAIATSAASRAPVGARIVTSEGWSAVAHRELWTGGSPGWSLAPTPPRFR